jgi:hypothetical protein
MGYREDAFSRKFHTASTHLGAEPHLIVSLKFRGLVPHYHEYGELIDLLRCEAGVSESPVSGDLQGTGHLLERGRQRVVLVEHETGLEVLYVTASIASILGLVLTIVQAWSARRGHHPRDMQAIEIRRLDSEGSLAEQKLPVAPHAMFPLLGLTDLLLPSALADIESLLAQCRGDIEDLQIRMTAIEGRPARKTASQRKSIKKAVGKTARKKKSKSRKRGK